MNRQMIYDSIRHRLLSQSSKAYLTPEGLRYAIKTKEPVEKVHMWMLCAFILCREFSDFIELNNTLVDGSGDVQFLANLQLIYSEKEAKDWRKELDSFATEYDLVVYMN